MSSQNHVIHSKKARPYSGLAALQKREYYAILLFTFYSFHCLIYLKLLTYFLFCQSFFLHILYFLSAQQFGIKRKRRRLPSHTAFSFFFFFLFLSFSCFFLLLLFLCFFSFIPLLHPSAAGCGSAPHRSPARSFRPSR